MAGRSRWSGAAAPATPPLSGGGGGASSSGGGGGGYDKWATVSPATCAATLARSMPPQLRQRLQEPVVRDTASMTAEQKVWSGLAQALYNGTRYSALYRFLQDEDDTEQRHRKARSHWGAVPTRVGEQAAATATGAVSQYRDLGNEFYAEAVLLIERTAEWMHGRRASGGPFKPLEWLHWISNRAKMVERAGDYIESFVGSFLLQHCGEVGWESTVWSIDMQHPIRAAICRLLMILSFVEDLNGVLEEVECDMTLRMRAYWQKLEPHLQLIADWEDGDGEPEVKRRSYEGYLKHASRDAARAAARKAKGRGKGKDKGKDKEHGATASSSSSGAVARHRPRDATPPLSGGGNRGQQLDKEHGATASSSSSGAVARHHPREAAPPLTFIERKEAARRRLLEDD